MSRTLPHPLILIPAITILQTPSGLCRNLLAHHFGRASLITVEPPIHSNIPIKNVAIAGASGNIGAHLEALAGSQRLLGKKTSSLEGARVTTVGQSNLIESPKGQDAIVCALPPGPSNFHLIDAAAESSIKLFVGSEFGTDHSTPLDKSFAKATQWDLKAEAVERAKSKGLPYVILYTGAFFDWGLTMSFLGVNARERKVNIIGTGDEKSSVTTTDGVGRAVVSILRNPDGLSYRPLHISDAVITQNQLFEVPLHRFASGPMQVDVAQAAERLCNKMCQKYRKILMSSSVRSYNSRDRHQILTTDSYVRKKEKCSSNALLQMLLYTECKEHTPPQRWNKDTSSWFRVTLRAELSHHLTTFFRTWKAEPSIVKEAVATAIEVDCAAIYGNERAVGEGISEGLKRAGISREDLFVTSKLWNTEHSSERILPACEQSIHDLGVKYLDLYLMHWPIAFKPGTRDIDDEIEVWETWEAMQREESINTVKMLKHEELVKSLGVSNFTRDQLQTLLEETDDKPSVNQVELHPYLPQPELAAFARDHSIHLSAYSPLGTGVNSRETHPVLIEDPFIYTIARKHNKTPAQVLIRWSIQSGFSSLPKSVTPQRIKENAQVFDFELDAEDMATIAKLNTGKKFVTPDWSHFAK
ncbi:aldehyde reductase [Planoprotostelium fungivorum]|uniref:Aldehyde reductase n=1 Tax=Planoprotostelium fungivorum TaxID=1890364 RepID=A0A2P6N6X0_9EUKA|nr:aldehyde reductase [Planoprotostelium fungivorum]